MKYRQFGSTDFKVSALGLGCMRLPTIPLTLQKADTKKSIKLIRSAIDQGVNYIDTAWPYHFGGSERVLGDALRDGYREKVHLVTKLFMPLVKKQNDFDSYLTKQLAKLQTDYLDTYLFHSMNKKYFEKIKKLKLIDKMIEAKEQGKIKYIGFSFHDTLPVFKEIVDYYNWDVVQIQYNYMDTQAQATIEGLKYAASKGMAVVVMEPLRGGQLANPPQEAKEVISKSEVKRSAVDWALQYLWDLPEVSTVISGMGTQKMLDENCGSADRSGINSLSETEHRTIGELVEIYNKNIKIGCTACQYCMKCPHGVNIPENFAFVNNAALKKGGIMQWLIKRSYKKMANSTAKLNETESNGNATLCTDCGICVPKCPQAINIPKELKKVDAVMGKGKKIETIFN